MDVMLVGNPTAQSGRNRARIQAAMQLFADAGVTPELIETEPEGRTVGKVQRALDAGRHDRVVAMGGDGTFAEVAKGVLDAEHPASMAMLPSGTANDQGKSFGLSSGASALADNVSVALGGTVLPIDVGHIQRIGADGAVAGADRFFDSCGFGMHPAILVRRNEDRRRLGGIPVLRRVYRDQAMFVGATVAEFLLSYVQTVKFTASIVGDGVQHTLNNLTDLVVNNTAVYGGIWVPARDGAPDDGLLDVVPLAGRRDMLSKLIRDHKDLPIWQEDLDALGIRHSEGFVAAQLEIELLRPGGDDRVASQLDGEEWLPGHHFRVWVQPRALPLVVPRGFVAPWAR